MILLKIINSKLSSFKVCHSASSMLSIMINSDCNKPSIEIALNH